MLAITTTSERTGRWIKMRRSLAPFTAPESLVHAQSLADFITTTSGFRFSVHTPLAGLLSWAREACYRPRRSPFDDKNCNMEPSAGKPTTGRQNRSRFNRISDMAGRKLRPMTSAVDLYLANIIPVSYTHL